MTNNQNDKTDHAPGRGSDKQHPETPSDANERFKKQQDDAQKNQNHKIKPDQ